MVDVRAAVLGLAADTVSVIQDNGPGSYVAGLWVAPTSTQTDNVRALVTKASGADVDKLPEGQRRRDTIRVTLAVDGIVLRPSDRATGTNADRVIWNGQTYEVTHLQDMGAYGYRRALCVLVGE